MENIECGAGERIMDSSFSCPPAAANESFLKISEYFYLFEHHFDLAAEQKFQSGEQFSVMHAAGGGEVQQPSSRKTHS